MSYEIKENFKKLTSVPGVCGYERDLTDLLSYITNGSHYTVSRDALGNLILRGGTEGGRRVMISAPLDAPGFLVTFIDGSGRLHLSALGSPALQYLPYRKVISARGVRGVIIPSKEDKIASDEDLTIDIGADDRADAERSAAIGDVFSLLPDGEVMGDNTLVAPAAGARICDAVLLDVAPRIADSGCEIYLVFTAQSRVAHRGAKVAAASIKPEIAITLAPMSFNGKNQGGQSRVSPGDGIISLIKDGQVVADVSLSGKMREIAGERLAERVSKDASSAASIIDASGLGCASLTLGIPLDFPSTPAEAVDLRDAALAIDAISELVLSL